MRDSTLARYAPRAIDFWSVLARPDGTIEPIYDSGDGIHLNSPAHRILFERVASARVLGETPTSIPPRPPPSELTLTASPTPFRMATTIRFNVPSTAWTTLTVYDAVGRTIGRLIDGTTSAGPHEVTFMPAGARAGAYFLRLSTGDRRGSLVVTLQR
jgi:hypothetical protein